MCPVNMLFNLLLLNGSGGMVICGGMSEEHDFSPNLQNVQRILNKISQFSEFTKLSKKYFFYYFQIDHFRNF